MSANMRRIYSTLRPHFEHKSYIGWLANSEQNLSVSSRSLVAFTSSFCLNQSCPNSISYHVYIADMNKPYQPYLLTQSDNQFILLEWDPSGIKLLVVDSRGTLSIYTSKDFLISDWRLIFEKKFEAERFITCLWYHPGLISTINIANQDLKNPSNHLEYSDKIQQKKFGASLRLFGGKAAEGCLLISRTGLIACLTLMSDGTVDVAVDSLGPIRYKLDVADISYHSDGFFIVGSSSGSINSTISFHKVVLSHKNLTLDDVDLFLAEGSRRINIKCSQYYSFHLNVMSQILNEHDNTSTFERVNQIRFVTKDSPNDVLIEVTGKNLSLIELWELETKKRPPVNSAILEFKRGSNRTVKLELSEETTNESQAPTLSTTKKWSFKGNYITDKDLKSIQVPKFKLFGSDRQLNIILLSYGDSTICCLRKDDLQPIDEMIDLSFDIYSPIGAKGGRCLEMDSKSPYKVFSTPGQTNSNQTNKTLTPQTMMQRLSTQQQHQKSNGKPQINHISDLQISANQTLFVAIDTLSQLHVVKLPTLVQCQDSRDEQTYLQYILEYCLITGNDWWDVVVCAKSDIIATICDKFHDAYERQPKHIQRMYFNRQLMMRASLHRCLNDVTNLCKSSDCHSMIMLNSIACTLKSMLRQSSDNRDSPAEQLSAMLRAQGVQTMSCVDVISKIEAKEYYIEVNLIQCLQPLIQWIVDFSIFLVASLPQRARSRTLLPGSGLSNDREALQTLRELLIIIKIWSIQNEASSPMVYKLNEQVDVITALYKLISMFATQANMSSNMSDPVDAQLLDECAQFTNNITVTQFSYFLPATGVASPLLHQKHQSGRRLISAGCESNEQSDQNNSYLMLEYFNEPAQPELVSLDKVEGSVDMIGSRKMDVVRNISLGAYPLANIRHCTRCSAVSLIKPTKSNGALSELDLGQSLEFSSRSWEQRWMTSCICGGSWAQSNDLIEGTDASRSISNRVSAHHSIWLQGALPSQLSSDGSGNVPIAVAGLAGPAGSMILSQQLAASVQSVGHQLVR